MKLLILLPLVFALQLQLSAQNLVLDIYQRGALGGRIQHDANPGKSDSGIKHIDKLPMAEVAVGPTQEEGVSMAFLMAFKTTPEFRQHLAAKGKVRLALQVVKTIQGGAPADLEVALLDMASVTNPDFYPQFGAFNKAVDFKALKTIDADPEVGLTEIDITEAMQIATNQPSADEPLMWFVVYLPIEKMDNTEGHHVVFSGSPKLIGIK